jgi:hypothetical protein
MLILICEQDAALALKLLARLEALGAWQSFNLLRLHLDTNVTAETEDEVRRATEKINRLRVDICRANAFGCWSTRRAETMLSVYKAACEDEQDIVRIDPDVFVASPHFINAVCQVNHGIAGKLMPLHLPALIRGRQLTFIQGGVTCWGKEGRNFLQALRENEIDKFRRTYVDEIEGMLPEHSSQYAYYFSRTEDVVLTGALAIRQGVDRAHIDRLQASPYDVIRNHRSERWTFNDFISAYERSGALAYHFEGGHSGRRIQMTEMLHRYYEQVFGTAPSSGSVKHHV